MFGLLKNKFKEFTSKIFGKGQEKVEETKDQAILEEEQVQETKPIVQETQEKPTTSIEEPKPKIEQETISKPEPVVIKEQPSIVKEQPVVVKQEPVITKEEPKPSHIIENKFESKEIKENFENLESKLDDFDAKLAKELEQFKEPEIKKEPAPIKPKVVSEVPKPEQKIEIKKEPEPIKPKVFSEAPKPEPKPEPVAVSQVLKQEPEKEKEHEVSTSERYIELESKKPEKVKTGVFTSIKSLFVSKVSLSEKEISDFLDDFEISLLEADVSLDAAKSIVDDLKLNLSNAKFSKSNLLEDIKSEIKKSLGVQLNIDCNMDNYISKTKDEPLIIMFVGPNGAGKTTTIARFAYMYKQLKKSVVFASSDTFRAGAIDQLEIHAQRLGVRVVKQNYNSDPAAVAFDAVTSARANKIDVVLIDTAGRQETNINLMQELQKIKRVVKPHLTIYVGESQSGQAIVDQIRNFDKDIGLTGVVLTKIDTDPKGGVAISILNELKKPIFYLGTGQEYENLEKFSPEYIIERIV